MLTGKNCRRATCIVILRFFFCRTSSQNVASSNVRQLGGGSTGMGGGRNGHLHHHLSVEELRLIQVKYVVDVIKYHTQNNVCYVDLILCCIFIGTRGDKTQMAAPQMMELVAQDMPVCLMVT